MTADTPALRYMPDGRLMQCKDIPDALIVEAVVACRRQGGSWWAQSWDVWPWLEDRIGELPPNLYYAKMRSAIRHRVIAGCGCGCRGDYHIPAECMAGCCPEAVDPWVAVLCRQAAAVQVRR